MDTQPVHLHFSREGEAPFWITHRIPAGQTIDSIDARLPEIIKDELGKSFLDDFEAGKLVLGVVTAPCV